MCVVLTFSSTRGSLLLSVLDGQLVPGDASAVKPMLEELAKNKDKIHGWDNKGSVREEDSAVCQWEVYLS